ncbi:MAG: biosynthetic-type acetolactate synthase large subunit [Planctomycetaceae bacterium]|nr:biosynthetic-type acetolactate synthase large subunit [Planctomycetaceae bacterium]
MSQSSQSLPGTHKSSDQQILSGADIVVRSLVQHGVTNMFAYPGGYTIPLHQALTRYRNKIRVILPRHEQGGGFAAQGIARSTGELGVCMVTSGPGATNLLTAIADAKLDSIPLLAICGQVNTNSIGYDAFQETPITEVCRSITKHHCLITDVKDTARLIKEAIYVATTGRPGPVLVDIPKNVQIAQYAADFDVPMNLPGYNGELRQATDTEVKTVADAIRTAKRPVLCVGGGVIVAEAAAELLKLVEKTQIPVTTTLTALSSFPREHPLSLGMPGMHGSVYANYAIAESDLLIAIGVRFTDRVTGKVSEFAKNATIIHVDIDPSEINKIKQANVAIVSDAAYFLTKLNRVVTPSDADLTHWHAKIDDWKKRYPLHYTTNPAHIVPQQAVEELWKATKDRDTIITSGVGQHQMWTAQFYKFKTPRTWLTSGGLGTMGFGLPAAMGAKAANPDKLVVNVDGDGSLQMNIQEMGACFCEKLPVKVMLLNNQHLGMVVQWEDRFYASNRGNTYLGPIDHPEVTGQGVGIGPEERYPDFCEIARGYGWQSRLVSQPGELADAVREMIESDAPFLLDVTIPYQEHVLPMIPAGGTVQDIILG